MNAFMQQTAQELGVSVAQVQAAAALLADGATVPFIARYRKEATDGLDEVQVAAVRDRLKALSDLHDRLEAMLKSLKERELLTDELEGRLRAAETLTALEDVYLPFRPKRRTKAMEAREKGLEPLALRLMEQRPEDDPAALADEAVAGGAAVDGPQTALTGARHILAEMMAENEAARRRLRDLFERSAVVAARVAPGQEELGAKYRDYFDWTEPLASIPSHRYLALRRAESEGVLTMSVQPDADEALTELKALFVKNASASAAQVEKAAADGYKRLLSPSLETEMRLAAKKKADAAAINVFAQNLRELLMAPPLGGLPILAVDPGYRTGCKAAALSADGALVEFAAVQLHAGSERAREAAGRQLADMIRRHGLAAAAVGNGTAGRETAAFIRALPDLPPDFPVALVSESGASIYSASEIAREEFPELDLTVRGAISIGRRLMDPLAELVKLEPKSIGVGQYQHDVDQGRLRDSLDDVVVSCVNRVGVEVNTASEKLLSYVSGLGPALAKNVVKFRRDNGPFKNRAQLLQVPRLGPKAFEQCAGFLRLASGDCPLDRSAVHPESYQVVEKMAQDLGTDVETLLSSGELRAKIRPERYVDAKVGLPTLRDIISELEKPGRDPRQGFSTFVFAEGLNSLEDVEVGQRLPGLITNVTAFGAFVDVGVHQDGLVHVSQLADRFVSNPADVVKVGQEVTVTVIGLDLARRRLQLSMKSDPQPLETGRPASKGPRAARPKNEPRPFNNPFEALKDRL
jgi:uncharacterized protein